MNFLKSNHGKLFVIFCILFACGLSIGGTVAVVMVLLGIPFGVAACIGVQND
jgi:hypothetical protein